MSKEIKRCRRCALPSSYPGIKFNQRGICNYCVYYDLIRDRDNDVRKYLQKKISKIIQRIKHRNMKYHCIVAYSGGKDSTFLLYFLKKKFGLNILAHVLDNGFISNQAFQNIKKVTKRLEIDCKITRPPFKTLREIFAYTLTQKTSYPKEILAMMSPVCAACQGIIFGTSIKLALRLNIPIMFIGYTPGQYPSISLENFLKVKSNVFLSSRVYKDDPLDIIKIVRDPINEKFGSDIERYYFRSQYIEKNIEEKVPSIFFPFHFLLDYDEKLIISTIQKLGWKKPEDTDACSTNCLLNTLGNYACLKQLGYHPYIGELSSLVRENKMSYSDAIKAEYIDIDSFAAEYSLKKLKINLTDIELVE